MSFFWVKSSNILLSSAVGYLINAGVVLGSYCWVQKPEKPLKNRLKFLFEAAQKRGIKIEILEHRAGYSRLCRASTKRNKIIFETLPSGWLYGTNPDKIDNKFYFKRILKKYGFQTPEGQQFKKIEPALKFAETLGYPVVVKPVNRSLSEGVSTNINNKSELAEAINLVLSFEKRFLVEKHINGNHYRFTIVGEKYFACRRVQPFVKGDGHSNIKELVNIRNDNPLRGPVNVDGWTLRKVQFSSANDFLKKNKISMDDIPKRGESVFLSDKVNLGSGADIYDLTSKIHIKNVKLLKKVAQLLKAPIIGFDVIADDLSKPHDTQTFFIIEANSIPAIDMHHVPFEGQAQDVAGAIWDLVLKNKVL